jgi:hypothetical protein
VESSYVRGLQNSRGVYYSVGSTTTPVYFRNGVPVECTAVHATTADEAENANTADYADEAAVADEAAKISIGNNKYIKIRTIEQADYDKLVSKESDVLYLII